MVSAKQAPRGRDEIRAAVLDAADALFSERRPSLVSVREIAEMAGVKHTLVHRHFDTKENLVREVIERVDERLEEVWMQMDDVAEIFVHLLAHRETYRHGLLVFEGAVLDGVVDVMPRSRIMAGLVARLEAGGTPPEQATAVTVAAMAVFLGWSAFGDWLTAVSGDSADAAAAEHVIAATLREIVSVR